jgi:hypothetical protein
MIGEFSYSAGANEKRVRIMLRGSLSKSRTKPQADVGSAGAVEITSDDPAIHLRIIFKGRADSGGFLLAFFYQPGDLGLYELREVAVF